MRIYLAARYSRREELCAYRSALEVMGHTVTSRWLNGTHQINDTGAPIGDHGESLIESDGSSDVRAAADLRLKFAQEDVADVVAADAVISFTERPRSTGNRGGRHVEFGIALALGKRLIVVGHRENLFHWMSSVEFFESLESLLAALRKEAAA